MNKILELRDKRAKAWDAAKAFLDTKRGTDDLISAEDEATYNKMEADVVALGKEIDRLERQAILDAKLNAPMADPITGKPANLKSDEKKGRASDEYKKAFWSNFRSISTPEIRNALQVGEESEGGYLAPDEYENLLLDKMEDFNIVRSVAHAFRTNSGSHKIPIVASKGGASWVDEEGAIQESDDSFGQISIGAYKVATLIKVSNELLNDSVFNLEEYISKEFGRRIGTKEEESFLIGDGVGKPTGIFHDTLGGEVGVTTNSPTAIAADEILDLYYSLKPAYRERGKWMLNESTVKAIRKLKDGNGNYLWLPGLKEGESDTLLGKKILTSAYIPEMSSGNNIISFGDYDYYWIGDRQGISFKRLNELYAVTDQVGFLATKRVDGRIIMPEAVKLMQMKTA